jgi:hypothetical protein
MHPGRNHKRPGGETLEEYNDNCHILAVYMYLFVTYTRRIPRALQQEFVKEIHYINVKI